MKNKHLPVLFGLIFLVVVVIAAAVIVGNKSKKDNTMGNMPKNTTTNTSTPNSKTANDTVETSSVTIKNYAFSPMSIKVKVGTTVTWTNDDSIRHTVTADEGEGPKSDLFGKGETYSYKFTKSGTFTYHCQPHPYMHGTVVVTD